MWERQLQMPALVQGFASRDFPLFPGECSKHQSTGWGTLNFSCQSSFNLYKGLEYLLGQSERITIAWQLGLCGTQIQVLLHSTFDYPCKMEQLQQEKLRAACPRIASCQVILLTTHMLDDIAMTEHQGAYTITGIGLAQFAPSLEQQEDQEGYCDSGSQNPIQKLLQRQCNYMLLLTVGQMAN